MFSVSSNFETNIEKSAKNKTMYNLLVYYKVITVDTTTYIQIPRIASTLGTQPF